MLLKDITMGEAFSQLRVGQKLYGLVGMFILFLLGGFMFTTAQIQAQRADFSVIDIAGRQRMLNQRYLQEVMRKAQGIGSQPELTRALMQTQNAVLLKGGRIELAKDRILTLSEAPNDKLKQSLKAQQHHETELFKAAESWLALAPDAPGRGEALKQLLATSARVQEISNAIVEDWTTHSQAKIQSSTLVVTFLLVLAIALGLVISHMLLNSILMPIRKLHAASGALMAKDLTHLIDQPGQDELGSASQSLNQAFAQLRLTLQTLLSHSEVISHASEELSTVSAQLNNDALQSSSTVVQLSAATQEININAEGIATAMEEMHASINEIAKVSANALNMGNQGAALVGETVRIVGQLDQSSHQIGKIVTMIESIAEQTNLLALNATIEAARAGESGKGFAVVANEVKELAQGTRQATQHVTKEIQDIQAVTGDAIKSIKELNTIIQSLNDIQAMIAASTEEQSVTTREMAKHINVTAKGNQEIVAGIEQVVQTSKHTSNGASSVKDSASQLARMATELEGMVQSFRI